MIIIQDSREQTPLRFSDDVLIEVGALKVGDYSLKGMEDHVAIERKSLPDLLGSLGKERDRFTREMRQMQGYRLAALVVETDWATVLAGDYPRSAMHPNAVVGSLLSMADKYGVIPILAGNHRMAGIIVERLLHLRRSDIERQWKLIHRAEKAVKEAVPA